MSQHRFFSAALAGASLLMALSANTVADSDADIRERLKPYGSVCMEGDCGGAAPVAAASAEPRSGEQIYNSKCTACHSTGAAGAPKLGDAAAWVDRIAKGNDVLYTSALSGVNAMPPKGLCMDCSDDEIKATVDYMVAKSQ